MRLCVYQWVHKSAPASLYGCVYVCKGVSVKPSYRTLVCLHFWLDGDAGKNTPTPTPTPLMSKLTSLFEDFIESCSSICVCMCVRDVGESTI